MAGESFGKGLALNYSIPRDQFAMAERAMKQRNDFDKAKAATKKADDAALQSWSKIAKIDYSKVHTLDNAIATKLGGEAGKIIEEARNSGDPNWQNSLYVKLQPIMAEVGELNVRKQQFDTETKRMADDEAAGNTYPEAIDYRKKIEAGDVEGVKNFKDRYGNISTSIDSKGRVVPSVARLTREDIDAEVKKEMNTDYNRSFLGRVMEAQIDPSTQQYLNIHGLPRDRAAADAISKKIGWTGQRPTTLEDIVENKLTNIQSRRGFIRQLGGEKGDQIPDEYFDSKTPEDRKFAILKDLAMSRYEPMLTTRSTEKSVRREKPTESDKTMAKQAGSIQENVPIKFYHNKKENTWNAEMFMGINTPVLNVSNADGTWDMQNNKKLTGADPSFKFEPTGIAGGEFLTAGIGSAKKKGLVVTGTKLQYDPKEYKLAEAELLKSKLIADPSEVDANGNPVQSEETRESIIMAKMEQDGKVQRSSVAVPLKSLKGTLEGKKINVAAAEKKWEEMNKSSSGTSNTTSSTTRSSTGGGDDYIKSILTFENSKGYKNFGFTSEPDGSVPNIEKGIEKFKKEYEPMVKDLPAPLKAVAADFAFNSEDPRASLVVAAGGITPEQKKKYYKNGKIDKDSVDFLWSKDGGTGFKQDVLDAYNKNPKAFLDAFDKERIRSYSNTNGADKKLDEWKERVRVSRGVADKILSGESNTKPGDNTLKSNEKIMYDANGKGVVVDKKTNKAIRWAQ